MTASSEASLQALKRPSAWIVSFGPVGSGSDGYLIRVESNAQALAALGFVVDVLEVSRRTKTTIPWPNVTTHPSLPSVVPERRIMGPLDLLSDLRGQIALLFGILRTWRNLLAADLVIVEGGLLALTFALRPFAHGRPTFAFDLITLMSSLHRHRNAACTFECKLRRRIWRVLERICVLGSDVAVVGSEEDAIGLAGRLVAIVPHAIVAEVPVTATREEPHLVGFLGNGRVGPNRDAVDFIVSSVLNHPGLESVRCRVIGDEDGYDLSAHDRLEFVGFHRDPSEALSGIGVCCAPMEGAGGVSTKVLAYLMNGKRTVCTPEAAVGIAIPAAGLWIVERNKFAGAVADALAFSWPPTRARNLSEWMAAHHGLPGLSEAWGKAIASERFVKPDVSPE